MKSYNIFEIFFSWENPAIYAVFFVFILLLLLFLIRNEFILPLVKSKRKLELENIKLAALYSEVDPDPIIRIGKNWNLLHMNTAAKTIFEAEEDKFSYLLNQLKSSYADNKNTIIEKIANNYYHIIIKDVPVSDYKHIYFRNITSRIEYEDQILNYQRHLKQLRVRLETSNEEEKQKLGRDLHDGIGHSLSLLKIEVQNYIKIKSLNIEEEEAMRLLNSIDVLTGEVRDLSHELRPRILEECGLVQA
ncbi:MAG: hypothetical protein KDC90_10795, partial [Ignavibacteriae bacterium]|nr:hypothetical protein [Ignavibacteriota bacterium]